jgi:magnesium-transporting ATPase (P-type)
MLSSLCNWGKNKQYLKLHDEIRNEEISVIRGQYGLSQTCKVTEIVVGDIIIIESGMRIPADCVILDGMDITCDESMYEELSSNAKKQISIDLEQHRNNPDCFLFSRSLIKTGTGRAVVCAVGKHTRWM